MSSLSGKFKTLFTTFRDSGMTGVAQRVIDWNITRRQNQQYQEWLSKAGKVDVTFESLTTQPCISVVVPVFNVDEKWLRSCIDSVVRQIYQNWELCIADDASTKPHVRRVLQEYSDSDPRIKVVFREKNGHISAASNSALEIATGEYVVLLDNDDELSPDALFWVAHELDTFPDAAIIYSDEDLIDENGRRFGPKFKPDFSRELFYSLNLLTHLSAFRTDLIRSIGGFQIGTEGSQDYDLELRVIEQIDESQIRHIPRILYHWRVIRGSVAFSMDEKPYAHERARDALRQHFKRTGVEAEVVESFHNLHRVSYTGSDPEPRVSVIVIDMGEPVTSEHDVVYERNAEALNQAATAASGEVLVFIDSTLRAEDADAIGELASFAMHPDIGAVGGRILKNSLRVEQAGIVLAKDLSPRPAHAGYARTSPGNMYRNRQIGNYVAISSSCMAIRKSLFEEAGGFDAGLELFDIDLCLRLREMKKRIVVLPHVEFRRVGPTPERNYSTAELARLRDRWPAYIEGDPFCNRNLKRDGSFDIDV
ncbi:MAG: hypothetical protein DMF63_14875 [Acidobacteria bacterium]|nr:MAG: hypothetical protein DMF63_14875 [Acidobacteriota bacterium]